jgi:hypothetical protein
MFGYSDQRLKSIKFFDLVKRNIDAQIDTVGAKSNAGRLLQSSKNKLVTMLDKISPDYATARSIYSQEAPPLQKLRESAVGKLSDLDEMQLKNVSKIIFDRNQTDSKAFNELRDQIYKKDPEAWNNIVRNEMERRIDMMKSNRTVNPGSSFYDAIMSNERDYQMFHNALKNNPSAQRKLADMRMVYRHLLNPESPKGASGRAKNFMNTMRNSGDKMVTLGLNLLGGRYDKAATKIITDPNIDKIYKQYVKDKASTPNEKTKNVLKLLQTISPYISQPSVSETVNKENK